MISFDTPCVVLEMEKVRANIRNMQEHADRYNCKLRPHIKTHKSVALAKMQMEAGAAGITCAKTTEAEVFADGGIEDIFIAYPLVGEEKYRRALRIKKKIKRLIVAVDSIEGARMLSDFAVREGVVFEARLEADTGARRTGAVPGKLRETGAAIRELPGLNITGVYTFKSMMWKNAVTNDAEAASAEEGSLILSAAEVLRELGFKIRDISAGSTPTGRGVAQTGLVNEIRPGTYIFYDWMTRLEGACSEEEIAAFVAATVVSTPSPGLAVIDAGVKTFSADVRLNEPPFALPGFAKVAGRDDLILDRLNEEHGMLWVSSENSKTGETGLRVGDVLRLIPGHICTAVNLQDKIYALEGGGLSEIPVDARGKVR